MSSDPKMARRLSLGRGSAALSRVTPPRLVVAALAILITTIGGCDYCTEVGCDSGVSMMVTGLDQNTTYGFRACIDGDCSGGEVEGAEPLDLYIALPRGFTPSGETVPVTLSLNGPEGMQEFGGDVKLALVQPNGPRCEPDCWRGDIQLP